MKLTVKFLKILLMLAAAEISATACSDTDSLCIPAPAEKPRQTVNFDWKDAPDASPAGMRLWLYPDDWQGDPTPLDLPGREGGRVAITPGRYHLISYNNDTEWIEIHGKDAFSSHRLATRDADILEPLGVRAMTRALTSDSTQRVAACPDAVWGASDSLSIASDSRIVITPTPLTPHFTFTFEDLGNLSHVAKASASISGMAPSVSLAPLKADTAKCTHPLAAFVNPNDSTISGSFYSFGAADAPNRENRMALYVLTDTGKAYKFTQGQNLDVTDQIRNAPDPLNVDIKVRGIKIPESEEAGAQYQISVDDWGTDIVQNVPI